LFSIKKSRIEETLKNLSTIGLLKVMWCENTLTNLTRCMELN